jgi:Rod binding domain-containing protein
MDAAIQGTGDLAMLQSTQPNWRAPGKTANVEAAAKDFEAMFMAQMLQPMFSGLETDEMFGGGAGEDVMRGLMVNEYGKSLATSGAGELSTALRAELLRLQDVADHKAGGG